jgi:riboflavin kinase/FMN adenylyltransferase
LASVRPRIGERAPASVVAPGNHDGVHLGHRALIDTARTLAVHEGLLTVALTFNPHPANILAPDLVPPLLTTIERRVQLLRGAGADEVIVQSFDNDFAALSPELFLKEWLIDALGARALVVGPDFGFGIKRSGNVETLRELGKGYGLRLLVVAPVRVGDQQVSSSAIRQAIGAGDVGKAALMLGRVHELSGLVVPGDGRGRTLGVPTANLNCDPVLKPLDGVYAVAARPIDPPSEGRYVGVANIGTRPTFGRGHSVEVHLIDFAGDLYGTALRVGFVKRLRGEKAFGEVDQLKAQIRSDIFIAREVLDETDPRILSWI